MRRTWQVGPYRDEAGNFFPLDPGELDREMVALGVALARMGGSAVVAPLRIKSEDGFATVGLAVKYDSGNVPAVEAQNGTPAEEPPEPAGDPETAVEPPEPAVVGAPLPEPPPEREPALTE